MEVVVNQIEKRSWVEVDLSQLKQNYLIYKKVLRPDSEIMAVIKADAYGHGDVQVARMLYDAGVRLFAVSNIDEAIGLREAGIKGEILILGYSSPNYARSICENDLTQAIVSVEYAEALKEIGLPIKAQFAIDTGMNRIGLDSDELNECEKTIRHYAEYLNLTGLFTHLCVADSDKPDDVDFTYSQLRKFNDVCWRVSDLSLPFTHCLNSAGGLRYLPCMKEDMAVISKIIRLGIILYGLKPDMSIELPQGIKPALSWMSVVSMVKYVKAGEYIGYGRTYKAKSNRIIATVATGYADGLNRCLSNKGFVLIKGQKAPIVGRICMDQTLVDVTDIPGVSMGDKVTILGHSGGLSYDADDMAEALGTIGYEIVCDISKRVQRFYFNSNRYL